ncbi:MULTISPECIES: nickel-dependent hydrogenase large subunit [unclassified Pseudomonas]|uniref:nickel-dependent hydrogenase large subunit n=1 Tax=unclassified Pseudomonas TaxID=196821 RepID=UPI002AC904ED|nr:MULTISPECIES: nickel-dependent hydrogenase large subunit [unclassified Pseudomonas]MEB0041115.1 nickel-dependent hydrogenase large subunit [Pseudomonas sp. MH10]MEB0078562.1 nickel-dependent hydrogenase large subunit [Pseudomonas sp. MH10out]MEB0092138.1 nickel-dependent hydrogenase large subunit [Pseudomonas sp. CCI4.2]MEB0100377.1 nickel-dependent hydrogenase large subunit [Pseudomonas sp. CCI3.2]MEB0120299.1 nickel-dependent hydrogenase large subunit [Pseudomonas sp. CCI1.2]
MTAANNLSGLGGSLRIRPGQQPSIIGGRPLLAARLLRGQPPEAAAQRLPLLYSLCGQAHGLTAQLAVNAALQGEAQASWGASQALLAETRREHLRRIVLNWSPLLDPSAERCSPVELRAWDQAPEATMSLWLGGPVRAWLEHWEEDPQRTLLEWTSRKDHWLSRALAHCREDAQTMNLPVQALQLINDTPALHAVAESLSRCADFALRPEFNNQPRETGSWTRLGEPHPERYSTAWLRLGARVAELARLSLPDARAPALGALALDTGEALAWSETARGLLLHRVCLECHGDGVKISDYQIVAPTEWNMHPQGALSQALSSLPSDDPRSQRQAELLMAAFDPCIAFTMETGLKTDRTTTQEPSHA